MDDPDRFEIEEYDGIDIFTPGSIIEREINWDQMFRILVLTGASFIIGIGFSLVITLVLIPLGLVNIDVIDVTMSYAPWAFIITSIGQLGFILLPIRYARKNGFKLGSVGLKSDNIPLDIILGLVVGALMFGMNLLIIYGLVFFAGEEVVQDPLLKAYDPLELIGWLVSMVVIVGLTEELLFRGFLQQRMEIYFRGKKKRYAEYALVISSFIFAALHLDLFGMPTRFLLGVILGYIARKRKYSILAPLIAHGINNFAVVVWNTYILLPI